MSVLVASPGHDLSLCIPDLKPRRKEAVLAEMVMAAHQAGVVTDPVLLVELLKLRERLGSTGVGRGVAVPHARSATVLVPRLVVGRSRRGIDWGAEDDAPASLILLVLIPSDWSDEATHGLIARATSAARLQRTRQKLLDASSLEALATLLREALA